MASELTSLAPFGAGNPRPIFRASGVEIVDGPRRMKERHLKMAFRQDGRVMRGIAWRASEREEFVAEHRTAIDLAFSLEQDTWEGERYCSSRLPISRLPKTDYPGQLMNLAEARADRSGDLRRRRRDRRLLLDR